MGNVASAIGGRAVYIAGAAIVIVAKPAYDRLVLRDTQAAANNQLAVVEADLKDAVALIKETRDSLAKMEDAIGLPEGMALQARRSTIECKIETMMLQAINSTAKRNGEGTALQTMIESGLEAMKSEIAKLETMMTKTNETVDSLPDKINTATKKYSMYLHDEHVEMFDLMLAKGNI